MFCLHFRTEIQCGDPGVPQNGMATPYGNSFDFDTVVRYTCNEGYTLAGSVNTRRCNENGRWTGATPVCQRKCYLEWRKAPLEAFIFLFTCGDLHFHELSLVACVHDILTFKLCSHVELISHYCSQE